MYPRLVLRTIIVFASLLLSSGSALSQPTIWFSPLTMSTGNSNLTIVVGSPTTAVRITSSATGGIYFVQIGLNLQTNVTIEGVRVCYQLGSLTNYISQTRITRMTTPDVATVFLDDPTDHNLALLECYTVDTSLPIEGTMTLGLRLEFGNTTDYIEIGAIGIDIAAVAGIDDPLAAPGHDAAVRLHQNHPNPFNPTTRIEYEVGRDAEVALKVYDPAGRLVRTLVDGASPSGRYAVDWDGRDQSGQALPSGAYYYRLLVGGEEASKSMVLLK